MKFFLTHLGCKLNQAEIESLSRQLLSDGHRPAAALHEADVHIVNSCTVTHVAARDSRKIARRAARTGQRLGRPIRTVLTGCYATGSEVEARALAGVDLVVTNDRKDQLVDLLYRRFPDLQLDKTSGAGSDEFPVSYVPITLGNARAALKIEDGCNMRCSFCIIPHTRGRQISRPVADVVTELRKLVELGFREVVVTGVQISSYRSGPVRLADLIDRMLDQTSAERLRLSSIAPWQFDPRLVGLVRNGRICRHFHLSLQSGSDATLSRMRRPYTTEQYRRLVAEIRTQVPEVAITTDVIAGFSGESEVEHQESLSFVREMEFARTHVFPYSRRPGTLAAELEDSVPPAAKKARVADLIEVASESERGFRERQLGSIAEILWEDVQPDRWRGMTDNYIRAVSVPECPCPGAPLPGTISSARLIAVAGSAVSVAAV